MLNTYLFENGYSLTLTRPPADRSLAGSIKLAQTVLSILGAVVQPLEVNLELGSSDPHSLLYPPKPSSKSARLSLREQPLPPYIDLDPIEAGDGVFTLVTDLSASVASDWMAKKLTSSPFTEATIIKTMTVPYSRARLLSAEVLAKGAILSIHSAEYGPVIDQVPIHKRADGWWVAGPTEHVFKSPFDIVLINNFGQGWQLDLYIQWSLWYRKATPEQGAVQAMLKALFKAGWQLKEQAGTEFSSF